MKKTTKKITKVTTSFFEGWVYNLTVKGADASYICESVSTKNCLACVALDGTRWPLGSIISDHPNGMCVFVPVMKSLDELGFELPPDAFSEMARAFHRQERPFPTMRSRFYQMSEGDQRAVFGNDLLYNLWKAEDFPLEALVVEREGMFVPASYRDVIARLEDLGGINHPRAALGTEYMRLDERGAKRFLFQMDPKDRANDRLVLVRAEDVPPLPEPIWQLDEVDLRNVTPAQRERAREIVGHYGEEEVPWWDRNEFFRTLDKWLRVDKEGNPYYAIPRPAYEALKRMAPPRPRRRPPRRRPRRTTRVSAETESAYPSFVQDDVPLLEKLAKNAILEERPFGAGINGAMDARLEGRVRGVLKLKSQEYETAVRDNIPVKTQYKREVAAYYVDRLLGVNRVPVTALRDDVTGAIQQFVSNAVGVRDILEEVPFGEMQRILTFDFIVGNTDRHLNNVLFLPSRQQFVFIDNGLAFPIRHEGSQTVVRTHLIIGNLQRDIQTRRRIILSPEGIPLTPSPDILDRLRLLKREDLDFLVNSGLLEEEAVDLMWKRIQHLVETGILELPEGTPGITIL